MMKKASTTLWGEMFFQFVAVNMIAKCEIFQYLACFTVSHSFAPICLFPIDRFVQHIFFANRALIMVTIFVICEQIIFEYYFFLSEFGLCAECLNVCVWEWYTKCARIMHDKQAMISLCVFVFLIHLHKLRYNTFIWSVLLVRLGSVRFSHYSSSSWVLI